MSLALSDEEDPAEGAKEIVDSKLSAIYLLLATSLGFVAFSLITFGTPQFAFGVLFVAQVGKE